MVELVQQISGSFVVALSRKKDMQLISWQKKIVEKPHLKCFLGGVCNTINSDQSAWKLAVSVWARAAWAKVAWAKRGYGTQPKKKHSKKNNNNNKKNSNYLGFLLPTSPLFLFISTITPIYICNDVSVLAALQLRFYLASRVSVKFQWTYDVFAVSSS